MLNSCVLSLPKILRADRRPCHARIECRFTCDTLVLLREGLRWKSLRSKGLKHQHAKAVCDRRWTESCDRLQPWLRPFPHSLPAQFHRSSSVPCVHSLEQPFAAQQRLVAGGKPFSYSAAFLFWWLPLLLQTATYLMTVLPEVSPCLCHF